MKHSYIIPKVKLKMINQDRMISGDFFVNDFPLKKKTFSVSYFGEFRLIPFLRDFHKLLTKITDHSDWACYKYLRSVKNNRVADCQSST